MSRPGVKRNTGESCEGEVEGDTPMAGERIERATRNSEPDASYAALGA